MTYILNFIGKTILEWIFVEPKILVREFFNTLIKILIFNIIFFQYLLQNNRRKSTNP